jgi:hypothetical protein
MIASIESTSEGFTFVVILKHLPGCAPGVTRTPDPRIRNPLLYPAELRAHWRSEVAATYPAMQLLLAQANEIDRVCGRARGDRSGRCIQFVAPGILKRKRCNEFIDDECASQIRRPLGFW